MPASAIVLFICALVATGRPLEPDAQTSAHSVPPAGGSESPTITITREPLSSGTISPFQYGQFIEYLCALTPSMFAEKIFDGGFEGVPDYKVAFRKQTDRLERPGIPTAPSTAASSRSTAQGPTTARSQSGSRRSPATPARSAFPSRTNSSRPASRSDAGCRCAQPA